jgi:hypothetical protein
MSKTDTRISRDRAVIDWLRRHPDVSNDAAAAELLDHFKGFGWPQRSDEEAYAFAIRFIERNRQWLREDVAGSNRALPSRHRQDRLRPAGGPITGWRDNC